MTLYQATPEGVIPLSKSEEDKIIAERQARQELAPTRKAAYVREQRNDLLAASDWTQANDSPLNDEKKTEWATYRTALRDLPSHSNWPSLEDSDWPTKPS
tara:strand:+ start:530 stop:829 length:300 start_codon:yes stop_codon:yes gene_type:complete